MRARTMLARLDHFPKREEEVKVWDLSLLSPEDQDRASELLKLIGNPKGKHAEDWVFVELHNLVHGLPLSGRDDPEQGPLIEVPHTLVEYWQRQQSLSPWRPFDFSKLSKIQTLRFVELCEKYGFRKEAAELVKTQMVPSAAWQAADRTELQDMLNIAAR